MSNRIFACAVAAPMCLIATPLVADVMFDNTLDGTRATNPNAQSTFSFTNGNARAFAFKIDDGFDFNLSFYGYLEGISMESAPPRRFGPPAHDQRGVRSLHLLCERIGLKPFV